jgi:hypothetical protein
MIGTLRTRRIRHAWTIIAALTLMAPTAALAQCDLKAEFGGVVNPTVPTGQPASLSIRFSNLATEGACPANQVRLHRTSATGPATVAAPMAFQALPALAPQGVALLTFQVESPLPATHVYELEYQTPHQDANNGNHRPTRTVTFTYPAVTLAVPDLMVTAVRPVGGLRVGGCNTVHVTVRNAGSATSMETQLTLRLFGPSPGVALVERKAIAVAAFAAGESRTIPVSAVLVPGAGAWRLEVMADATTVVTETNEANNTRVETITGVSSPCAP